MAIMLLPSLYSNANVMSNQGVRDDALAAALRNCVVIINPALLNRNVRPINIIIMRFVLHPEKVMLRFLRIRIIVTIIAQGLNRIRMTLLRRRKRIIAVRRPVAFELNNAHRFVHVNRTYLTRHAFLNLGRSSAINATQAPRNNKNDILRCNSFLGVLRIRIRGIYVLLINDHIRERKANITAIGQSIIRRSRQFNVARGNNHATSARLSTLSQHATSRSIRAQSASLRNVIRKDRKSSLRLFRIRDNRNRKSLALHGIRDTIAQALLNHCVDFFRLGHVILRARVSFAIIPSKAIRDLVARMEGARNVNQILCHGNVIAICIHNNASRRAIHAVSFNCKTASGLSRFINRLAQGRRFLNNNVRGRRRRGHR